MRTKLPSAPESVILGFLAGLIAGVIRGDLTGALVQAVVGAIILGMLRVALGIIYDIATSDCS